VVSVYEHRARRLEIAVRARRAVGEKDPFLLAYLKLLETGTARPRSGCYLLVNWMTVSWGPARRSNLFREIIGQPGYEEFDHVFSPVRMKLLQDAKCRAIVLPEIEHGILGDPG
jgi:hypothetical protein